MLGEFTQEQVSAVMLTQFQFGIHVCLMLPASLFHSRKTATADTANCIHYTLQQPDRTRNKERYARPNKKQGKARPVPFPSLLGISQFRPGRGPLSPIGMS